MPKVVNNDSEIKVEKIFGEFDDEELPGLKTANSAGFFAKSSALDHRRVFTPSFNEEERLMTSQLIVESPKDLLKLLFPKRYEYKSDDFLKIRCLLESPELAHIVKPALSDIMWEPIKSNPLLGLSSYASMQRVLKRPTLIALDLALADSHTKCNKKNAAHNLSLEDEEVIAKFFMPFRDFFYHLMYGPDGYYSTGKIQIKTDNVPADIFTCAHNKALAIALAEQMLTRYEEKHPHGEEIVFNVMECGAGEGQLCYNILAYIKEMADQKSETSLRWRNLYNAMHYTILEIAPGLLKRQRKRLVTFKEKVNFIEGDARKIPENLKQKEFALVFSNELLDMFPPHKVCLTPEGVAQVCIVVAKISKQTLQRLRLNNKKIEQLEWYSKGYKYLLASKIKDKSQIILSKEDFYELFSVSTQSSAENKVEFENNEEVFSFEECYVDLRFFPELQRFTTRYRECLEKNQYDAQYLCVDLQWHLESLEKILPPDARVIFIDYGGNIQSTPNHNLLVTKDGCASKGMASGPYKNLGEQDLSHYIDFTAIYALATGFEVVEFGDQKILLREIDLAKLTSKDDLAAFEKSAYKACILKRSVPNKVLALREEKDEKDPEKHAFEGLLTSYQLFKWDIKHGKFSEIRKLLTKKADEPQLQPDRPVQPAVHI